MYLDVQDRRVAARPVMRLHGKPSGAAGRNRHDRRRVRSNLRFDAEAVKVQDDGAIARPAERSRLPHAQAQCRRAARGNGQIAAAGTPLAQVDVDESSRLLLRTRRRSGDRESEAQDGSANGVDRTHHSDSGTGSSERTAADSRRGQP